MMRVFNKHPVIVHIIASFVFFIAFALISYMFRQRWIMIVFILVWSIGTVVYLIMRSGDNMPTKKTKKRKNVIEDDEYDVPIPTRGTSKRMSGVGDARKRKHNTDSLDLDTEDFDDEYEVETTDDDEYEEDEPKESYSDLMSDLKLLKLKKMKIDKAIKEKKKQILEMI